MLATPLQIGPVRLSSNLLLAPIAGYCDLAFRTLCREASAFGIRPPPHTLPHTLRRTDTSIDAATLRGAAVDSSASNTFDTLPPAGPGLGLACTDLLSPQGLLRGTATSLDLAKTNDFDKPVGMQLYGSDPEIMAQGARWAVEHGATIVDINMGCPVDKVTKKDGGSALLTNLERAVAIAKRVREELDRCPLSIEEWQRRLGNASLISPSSTSASSSSVSSPVPSAQCPVPLTCKMRLCWHTADYESGNACSPHLARMLADVGVAAVTVHGRTTEMKFSGEVQLAGIARVVESINGRIPVIGNGDVREAKDAVRMIRETGCSGVMIGRGALSTPWIFRDAWALQRHIAKMSSADGEMAKWPNGQMAKSEGNTDDTAFLDIPGAPAPTEAERIGFMRRYFDLMRQHQDDRYAMFQINRRVSWFAKRLGGGIDDTGKPVRTSCKPFKEAVRTAKTPAEVYELMDRYLAGEMRGGLVEQEEAGV